jgi:bidirectional [NiFe] hydrogenase diaphorase subunit
MPIVTIDGQSRRVKENSTVLEAAIELDIFIPTLCYDGEVSPGARCKLCSVEVTSPDRKDPLVLACTYKIKEDTEVVTNTPAVLKSRKKAMTKLLTLAPRALRIKEMAEKIGIPTEAKDSGGQGCILCGLCVRACKEIVGRAAIAFKKEGESEKAIQPDPDRCIACGTCVYICPSGYIKMEETGNVRIIWDKVFKKKDHLISGKYYAPLDCVRYVAEKEGVKADEIDTRCVEARKYRSTGKFGF